MGGSRQNKCVAFGKTDIPPYHRFKNHLVNLEVTVRVCKDPFLRNVDSIFLDPPMDLIRNGQAATPCCHQIPITLEKSCVNKQPMRLKKRTIGLAASTSFSPITCVVRNR